MGNILVFVHMHDRNLVSFPPPPPMDIQLSQNQLFKKDEFYYSAMSSLLQITCPHMLGPVFGFFILFYFIQTYLDFLHICARIRQSKLS